MIFLGRKMEKFALVSLETPYQKQRKCSVLQRKSEKCELQHFSNLGPEKNMKKLRKWEKPRWLHFCFALINKNPLPFSRHPHPPYSMWYDRFRLSGSSQNETLTTGHTFFIRQKIGEFTNSEIPAKLANSPIRQILSPNFHRFYWRLF